MKCGLCVGRDRQHTKAAEPIEMSFVVWIHGANETVGLGSFHGERGMGLGGHTCCIYLSPRVLTACVLANKGVHTGPCQPRASPQLI